MERFSRPQIWIGLILVISTAYFGVLSAEFVNWDDMYLVVNNPLIRNYSPQIFTTFDPELYIPVTLLTYQLQYALSGMSAGAFHAGNLLLHIINVLLVFELVLAWKRQKTFALLVALIFGLHPFQVEAVAWISARKDLLATTFFLSSVLIWIRSGRFSDRGTLKSIVAYTLSLLSKISTILLPGVLVMWERTESEHLDTKTWKRIGMFFPVTVLLLLIALAGKSEGILTLSPLHTVTLAMHSTVFYLQKFIIPVGFGALYRGPADLSVLSSLTLFSAGILGTVTIALWMLRKNRDVLFAASLFALSIAPSFLAYAKSNTLTLAADRYMYLPLLGLAILSALLLSELLKRYRTPVAILCIALFVTLGWLTVNQVATWKTTYTLFEHLLEVDPQSHIALNNIGNAALSAGEIGEATVLIDHALALNPDYPEALVNRAVIYAKQKNYIKAEELLHHALKIIPEFAPAHFNLGGIDQVNGQYVDAQLHYEHAVASEPNDANAHFQLARVLVKQGNLVEAREHYDTVFWINPDFSARITELH